MSQPYQSRILRKVLSTTQQWADRSAMSWRSLRSHVAWGAQLLVSPFFAAFHAGERLGFQVKAGTAAKAGLGGGPSAAEAVTFHANLSHPTLSHPTLSEPPNLSQSPPLPRWLQGVESRAPVRLKPAIAWLGQLVGAIVPTGEQPRLPVAMNTAIAATEVQSGARSEVHSGAYFAPQTQTSGQRSPWTQRLTSWLKPPSLPPDRAVQQALLSVNLLLLPSDLPVRIEAITALAPHPLPPTLSLPAGASSLEAATGAFIRGIASDRPTRSLVLVSSQNQVLAILSPEQQAMLQAKITQALGDTLPRLWLRGFLQTLGFGREPSRAIALPGGQRSLMDSARINSSLIIDSTLDSGPETTSLPGGNGAAVLPSSGELTVVGQGDSTPTTTAKSLTDKHSPTTQSSTFRWPSFHQPTWNAPTANPTVNARATQPSESQLPAANHSPPQASIPQTSITQPGRSPQTSTSLSRTTSQPPTQPPSPRRPRAKARPQATPKQIAPKQIAVDSAANRGSRLTARSRGYSSELKSPFIELRPTLLGYIQTPWEQVLRWCDRLLTWCENLVLTLRHWLQAR